MTSKRGRRQEEEANSDFKVPLLPVTPVGEGVSAPHPGPLPPGEGVESGGLVRHQVLRSRWASVLKAALSRSTGSSEKSR